MIYKFKCSCGALRHTDNAQRSCCGFCGEQSKLVEEYGATQIAIFEDEPSNKKEAIKKITSKSATVCGRPKHAIPNSKPVIQKESAQINRPQQSKPAKKTEPAPGMRIIKGVVNDKAVFDAGNI